MPMYQPLRKDRERRITVALPLEDCLSHIISPMRASESAPVLGAAAFGTDAELPEDPTGLVPRIKNLEPLIEYYIGRQTPQTPHGKRVNKLIRNLKKKIQRELEVPDWAKVTPVYDNSEVQQRAIVARQKDDIFPTWVKNRRDFQTVFRRFNEKVADINVRVRIPIRKHTEERTADDVNVIMEWVSQFEHLQHLNEDRLRIVCGKIKHVDLNKGESLFKQGDTENKYYMIVSGSVAFQKRGELAPFQTFKAGATFGEEALTLSNESTVRQSTCTALEKRTCLAMLRGYTYRESMKNFESQRTNNNRDFLEGSVPLVKGWSWQRLLQLAAMLELERFPEGATISKQGDPAGKMYFIKSGTVTIKREISYSRGNKWPTSKRSYETVMKDIKHSVQLDVSYKGDYCCEEGLMGYGQRECTVVAKTPVELLSFSKEDALQIITRQAKKVIKERANIRFKSSDRVAKDYLLKKRQGEAARRAKRLTYGVKYLLRKTEGEKLFAEQRRQKLWREKVSRLIQQKQLEKSQGSAAIKKSVSLPNL